MIKCFDDLIERTMEEYVDHIVVKTRWTESLLHELRETFDKLKPNRIKLNLQKCVFGISGGMLLDFLVSERGIEANPKKGFCHHKHGGIQDLKGIQRVMGCLASLSCFLSCLKERGLPLYKLLRKVDCFEWLVEVQEALDGLKSLLT